MSASSVDFNYNTEVLRNQRTARGVEWEKYEKAAREIRASRDPAVVAAFNEANQALVGLRDLGPAAVHVDMLMDQMSIRYQNDEFIGDRLMSVVTVGKVSNRYAVYDERAQLSFPDDSLSEDGEANEVNQGLDLTNSYNCQARGLKGYVDVREMENADAPLNPLMDQAMIVAEGIAFNREIRYASKLSTSGNFASSNVFNIAAGDEWNSANGGNPIKMIHKAVDAVRGGRNPTKLIGYCSVNVFRALSRHPAIRDLFKYEKDGFATSTQLANYFDMDELLVGRARKDSANAGQTEADVRIWSDVFGIVRVAPNPTPYSYQFGVTFRNGPIETVQLFDRVKGKKGRYIVKVTADEDYRIVASRAGALITNPIDTNLV